MDIFENPSAVNLSNVPSDLQIKVMDWQSDTTLKIPCSRLSDIYLDAMFHLSTTKIQANVKKKKKLASKM
jgi:hypothetical protein